MAILGGILEKYRWSMGRYTDRLNASPLTDRWGTESSQDRQ